MNKLERILLNLPPVKFVTDRSKHIILPGFDRVPLYDVGVFFFEQVKKVGLTERASAVSYNFIMAIPPTCLFLFTLIPQLPFIRKRSVQWELKRIIRDMIPAPEYNKEIIKFVDGFWNDPKIGLLSFGFILLIFFASNGMMGLMRSFNKNYIGFQRRTGLQTRWAAIKLTLLMMGLIFSCLLLLSLQGIVLSWMGISSNFVKSIIKFVRWGFLIALIFYAFGFIYKYAPAIKKRWSIVSPGSILATFLSILSTVGFSLFVSSFGKYNALYGSIGTIIVLMIVIYINSLVLLIGYELNVSIHSIKALSDERVKHETSGQLAK
ncbi:YihY/virulence factor BrkB family protein [Paraflavitalea sp. CAU 1676]|uniref:YihY/virulence factor BrkB family protein n=1 Tax=Paraflavitalea sp. CAU 1676 TaxID=3032598 RepID=UPI0023DB6DBA|nr:YihY/virulence factor BrkB family protein [Paraflavitalea sp. CAU 1676]MDF2191981.1 YihY/virulence factor BrkB family protein [Paraflavitalea sp. CAU 1676]